MMLHSLRITENHHEGSENGKRQPGNLALQLHPVLLSYQLNSSNVSRCVTGAVGAVRLAPPSWGQVGSESVQDSAASSRIRNLPLQDFPLASSLPRAAVVSVAKSCGCSLRAGTEGPLSARFGVTILAGSTQSLS